MFLSLIVALFIVKSTANTPKKHAATIRAAGGSYPPRDPANVKVATWNMYDRMNLMKENQKERFCYAVNDVFTKQDWDIVVMQEVFDTDTVVDSCKMKHRWSIATGPTPGKWVMINSGLLVMSKYMITAVDFHKFSVETIGCTDALAAKGVLFAKISVGDYYVYVFNTHLQGLYHTKDFEYKTCNYEKQTAIRKNQIHQLFTFMSEVLDQHAFDTSNDQLFLMGDFNLDPYGPSDQMEFPTKLEYELLVDSATEFSKRFESANLVLKDVSKFAQDEFTWPANVNPKTRSREKIDYIFRVVPQGYTPPEGTSKIINPATSEEQRATLTENEWVRNFMTFSDHKAIEYQISEGETLIVAEPPQSSSGFGLFVLWLILISILGVLLFLWRRKLRAEKASQDFVRSNTPRRELLCSSPVESNRIPPTLEQAEQAVQNEPVDPNAHFAKLQETV